MALSGACFSILDSIPAVPLANEPFLLLSSGFYGIYKSFVFFNCLALEVRQD